MKLELPIKIISFAYTEFSPECLYVYYFAIEDGKSSLHSIDKFAKNGKSGNGYKKEEVFHFAHKDAIYNYDTNTFESPKVPSIILENVSNYHKGFLFSEITKQTSNETI